MSEPSSSAYGEPRPRRLGEFPEIQDERKKLNPQSIRRVIYDIIIRFFNRNVTEAAQQFERSRRTHKDRWYRTEVKAEGYYDIIRDEQHLRYMHLEAIAIYLGVPVSLILFYTRLRADQSEVEDPQGKNEVLLAGFARVVLDAATQFLEFSKGSGRRFEFDDLIRWVELFKSRAPESARSEPEEGQLTLPGFTLEHEIDSLRRFGQK